MQKSIFENIVCKMVVILSASNPNGMIYINTPSVKMNAPWFWKLHDDVIKWKHFPRYWPFVWEIHRSPVNCPHKDQWRGILMFSLICAWINGCVNNREAGDLRRPCAHYDVTVIRFLAFLTGVDCNSNRCCYLSDTPRNNNAIITSKRRRGMIMTLSLRHVPPGIYTHTLTLQFIFHVERLRRQTSSYFESIRSEWQRRGRQCKGKWIFKSCR